LENEELKDAIYSMIEYIRDNDSLKRIYNVVSKLLKKEVGG